MEKIRGHTHFAEVIEHDLLVWSVEGTLEVRVEKICVFDVELGVFHGSGNRGEGIK
jgi:hypothetical protein